MRGDRSCSRPTSRLVSWRGGGRSRPRNLTSTRSIDCDLNWITCALHFAGRLKRGQVRAAARLALGLTTYWQLGGHFAEGRSFLASVLNLGTSSINRGDPPELAYVAIWPPRSPPIRVSVRTQRPFSQSRYDAAEQMARYAEADALLCQAVDTERREGDTPGLIEALTERGALNVAHGDREVAAASLVLDTDAAGSCG
jgi:hypothetical protein